MSSFAINNFVIKFPIFNASHMYIDRKIVAIVPYDFIYL